MTDRMAIYLAGRIQKGHEAKDELYWESSHMALLRQCLPDRQISFLNPAFRADDLSNQRAVFGRDMLQVYCADVVMVDAREKCGMGVGAEMMWAKFHHIPVITWAPVNTHYRWEKTSLLGVDVENFVHPFVDGLSDYVFSTLEEAALWIREYRGRSAVSIKSVGDIRDTVEYYVQTQLESGRDTPMMDLIVQGDLEGKLQTILERQGGARAGGVAIHPQRPGKFCSSDHHTDANPRG